MIVLSQSNLSGKKMAMKVAVSSPCTNKSLRRELMSIPIV